MYNVPSSSSSTFFLLIRQTTFDMEKCKQIWTVGGTGEKKWNALLKWQTKSQHITLVWRATSFTFLMTVAIWSNRWIWLVCHFILKFSFYWRTHQIQGHNFKSALKIQNNALIYIIKLESLRGETINLNGCWLLLFFMFMFFAVSFAMQFTLGLALKLKKVCDW